MSKLQIPSPHGNMSFLVSTWPSNSPDANPFEHRWDLPTPWSQIAQDTSGCLVLMPWGGKAKSDPQWGLQVSDLLLHLLWMRNEIELWGVWRPGQRIEFFVTFFVPLLRSLLQCGRMHILPSGSVAAMRGCTWSEHSLLVGVKRHPLESHKPRLTVRTLYCNTMINVSDFTSGSWVADQWFVPILQTKSPG